MYKVAVIGDKDSVYGFSSLGLDVYYANSAKEAAPVFKELAEGQCAVIYITEQLAEGLSAEIEKYSYLPTPAVILIPGLKGNTGLGITNVKKSVEKAVGSDIIFND